MSASEVSIANSALIEVGADRISSLTQNTRVAIIVNAIFESCRDDVLRAHPWNFAIRRATLAPLADPPDHEWSVAYDWPNDCLRPLEVYPDTIDWVSEDRKIFCNEPGTIKLKYIYKNEDPSSWDSNFTEALALRIASKIAFALTQSASLSEVLQKRYEKCIAQARSMDGAEGILKNLEIDTWTMARR